MNGSRELVTEFAEEIASAEGVETILCPPATLLRDAFQKRGAYALGGQDCHSDTHGAFTGDISAAMLAEAGCAYVILGHSERRQHHAEPSKLVAKKALTAQAAGLTTIICIGESAEERKSGKTDAVLTKQLAESLPASATVKNTIIAYEPIWAIGSGKTPTAREIAEAIALLRDLAKGKAAQVLYGGSVNVENAPEIAGISGVGGALVGGASLQLETFQPIIDAFTRT